MCPVINYWLKSEVVIALCFHAAITQHYKRRTVVEAQTIPVYQRMHPATMNEHLVSKKKWDTKEDKDM